MTQMIRSAAAITVALGVLATASPLGYTATTAAHQGTPVQWDDCPTGLNMPADGLVCTEVVVPVDYAQPGKETTTTLVGKMSARSGDPQGTLVVTTGARGGAKHTDALEAKHWLSSELLDQFDIIAIGQRGLQPDNSNRCFGAIGTHQDIQKALRAVPTTRGERLQYVASAEQFADACQESLSAADVATNSTVYAKDLNQVRQALGVGQLNLFAESDQSHAAQLYVNMFPNTVRAFVLNGFHDGRQVQGSPETAGQSAAQRVGTSDAYDQVLADLLTLCDTKGPEFCPLAMAGDESAQHKVDAMVAAVTENPLWVDYTVQLVSESGDILFEQQDAKNVTREILVQLLGEATYAPQQMGQDASGWLLAIWRAVQGKSKTVLRLTEPAAAEALTATRNDSAWSPDVTDSGKAASLQADIPDDDSYYKSTEDFQLITRCNDSSYRPGLAAAADRSSNNAGVSKLFGQQLVWSDTYCHGWPDPMAHGEASTFDVATDHPMLLVNARNSAEFNYQHAKAAAGRYPNAVLLTDETWLAEFSYDNSSCVRQRVDEYLLTLAIPEELTCEAEEPVFDRLAAEILPGEETP